jgi:hypothetical protein
MATAEIRELRLEIVEFVDEYQPGVVKCEFRDADGQLHTLIEKVPIVSLEQLDAGSSYPTPGCVRCEVLARWVDSSETERVRISTASPYHIESTEGRSEFVVLSAQIKPHYTLDELLEGADRSVPLSEEEREWRDAPPVGRELL